MDLDEFYSKESIKLWEKVLGPKMHYHFGIPNTDNDPFDQAILNFFPYIKQNSKVLDCGCGWGGPGKLIQSQLGCDVTGVTISKTQSEYIKSFKVIHSDLHEFIPQDHYDVAMFIESYTHLNDTYRVLNSLSSFVDCILIKDYLCDEYVLLEEWNMHLRTKQMFIDELEKSGYSVRMFNIIENFWQPGIDFWYSGLMKLNPMEIRGQLKGLFQLCYKVKFMNYGIPQLRQCEIVATKSDKYNRI